MFGVDFESENFLEDVCWELDVIIFSDVELDIWANWPDSFLFTDTSDDDEGIGIPINLGIYKKDDILGVW